jgi:NAD(P)-dependent dehydrogenase (short-subunit alcohol dehydrogenase family)
MVVSGGGAYDWCMRNTPKPGTPTKTVLITGASSGIGWATAELLVRAGYRVYGTGRAKHPAGPVGVAMRTLDVEDEASVRACVDAVIAEAGAVDVLVSNAARLVHGLVEEVPLGVAQRMFEANFWGAARMVNAVLPGMRARRQGRVVIVGSISNWVTVPLNGFYSASKAALSRYTEALRSETQHLGIRVALIEPSDVTTPIWQKADKLEPRLPEYRALAERMQSAVSGLVNKGLSPAEVGQVIARVVDEKDPAPVYRVGALAKRMPWLRVVIPARSFERGMRKRFGIEKLNP